MKMVKEVPNYIDVDGFQAMCIYMGMKKSCRRCGLQGHLSYNCVTECCRRCGDFGHPSESCSAPCKKCGEDHATFSCNTCFPVVLTVAFPPRLVVLRSGPSRPTPAIVPLAGIRCLNVCKRRQSWLPVVVLCFEVGNLPLSLCLLTVLRSPTPPTST